MLVGLGISLRVSILCKTFNECLWVSPVNLSHDNWSFTSLMFTIEEAMMISSQESILGLSLVLTWAKWGKKRHIFWHIIFFYPFSRVICQMRLFFQVPNRINSEYVLRGTDGLAQVCPFESCSDTSRRLMSFRWCGRTLWLMQYCRVFTGKTGWQESGRWVPVLSNQDFIFQAIPLQLRMFLLFLPLFPL